MNTKGDTSGTLLLILVIVTFMVVLIFASVISSELQSTINLMYEHLIEMMILLVLIASLPIIIYYAIEKKNKVFDFLAIADAITIAVIVALFIFPYVYAISSGNVLHLVSAKISANIEVPATIFGYTLSLTSYSFNYVRLDGYYPNTAFGSVPISFSLFNGNKVYTEVDAYCSPKANENYTLVSSGSVASVFPSFTFGYSKTVNVTVPNLPIGDNCLFRVYLKNPNGQRISPIFSTGITQVSPDTPAQMFSQSYSLPSS